MAKFYGPIGYAETKETTPGVYTETIVEKNYSGDVLRNSNRWQANEKVNDDLIMDNEISILADAFAYQNFYSIRYVKWMGAAWKVTKVTVLRPRLILTLGGVYNGNQGPTSVTP